MRSALLLLLMMLSLLTTGCGASTAAACSDPDRTPFLGSLQPITTRWNDVLSTASAASGPTLATSLDQMKSLQSQVRELQTPSCASPARDALLTYMGTSIQAYDAKLAGQPQSTVDGLLKQAESQFAEFQRQLVALGGGRP